MCSESGLVTFNKPIKRAKLKEEIRTKAFIQWGHIGKGDKEIR